VEDRCRGPDLDRIRRLFHADLANVTVCDRRRSFAFRPGRDYVDQAATYGVFVYGSVVLPAAITGILGHAAVAGADYVQATLSGWRRTWNVCTDNTTSTTVQYFTPGTDDRPPVQVLFLDVERRPGARVTGVLIHVRAEHLRRLDAREGNYDRAVVTGDLTISSGTAPDVVWTYVGKPARVRRARAAIEQGSARIRQAYLDTVMTAFAGNADMRAELAATMDPPPAPIEDLERWVLPPA
jgi:hypothetical protein